MGLAHPGSFEKLIDLARACIDEERRRTTDELHALDTFVDEIRGLTTESVSFDTEQTTVMTRTTHADGETTGLGAVQDAYEETLMSASHYEEEYDDTYVQSVAEEFGPDLATALTERPAFDDRIKRAVLSAATEAQTPREALLAALDTEDESLDVAHDRLRPIVEELEGFTASPLSDRNFETLDAYRARLSVLEEQCDQLAARRQSTLREQRHGLWMPVEGPDVPTYAYQRLDVDYPVLSAVTAFAERIEATRGDVERAMGYCN